MNKLAKGGGIHINPENKGKFTASAQNAGMGVQAFAQHVLANKDNYSSTQVKRANFAHNAAGWNHGAGGYLFAGGGKLNETPATKKPNVNQKTAEIYQYVSNIVQQAKANGDLGPDENLNVEGIVGQILQESGNGLSQLTLQGNNFGGIKADSNWSGETIKMGGATYRKFATPEEGLKNQVYFYIDNPRYRKNGVMQATTPEEHLKAVQRAGYAGDKNYVENTMKMVHSIAPRLKKAGATMPAPQTNITAPIMTTDQLEAEMGENLNINKLGTIPVTKVLDNISMPTEPVTTQSQYGSVGYDQKIPDQTIGDISIPTGWFGAGKSMFNYGGSLNHNNMRGYYSYAAGGPMGQLTEFNAGGLHEENPMGGIPQGMAPDGQVNLVEQGETKLDSDNYVFSDKLKVDKAIAEKFNLPNNTIGKTFAEASKKLNMPHSRREGDDIETKAKQKSLQKLMEAQEEHKQIDAQNKIAELQAMHPGALESLVGQQGGMPPQGMPQEGMGMEQPMSPEEQMMMQQQMQGAPQGMEGMPMSYGGSMYAFGGNMKNPETAQKWAKGLGMVSPFLNLIPGVGQVASLATAGIAGGLNMAAQNGMQQQAQEQQMLQANRMGNDYGGANPNLGINPTMQFAYGGMMGRQLAGGTPPMYGLNDMQKGNIGYMPNNNYYNTNNPALAFNLPNVSQDDNSFGMPMAPQTPNTVTTSSFAPNTPTNSTGVNSTGTNSTTKKDSPYNTSVDDTNQDLTVNETVPQFIGKYLPAAVNLGRGIFEKVERVRPEDFYTKINPYRMDFNPARRDAEQSFASLQNSLAGAGPGAGAYMTNMQAANALRNKNLQEINAAEENAYATSKFQADATNAAALTDARKTAYGLNLANRAAKNAIFNQGLTDISDIAKANQANDLATSYYSIMAPDFKGQVGFNPLLKRKKING